MFLPQVVKSAGDEEGCGVLLPYIERRKNCRASCSWGQHNGTIIMATVKGDVHDIGKNIVGSSCSAQLHVIDLGVMVPAQKILDARRSTSRHHRAVRPDHPVLDEMVNFAVEMERQGCRSAADRWRDHLTRPHGREGVAAS